MNMNPEGANRTHTKEQFSNLIRTAVRKLPPIGVDEKRFLSFKNITGTEREPTHFLGVVGPNSPLVVCHNNTISCYGPTNTSRGMIVIFGQDPTPTACRKVELQRGQTGGNSTVKYPALTETAVHKLLASSDNPEARNPPLIVHIDAYHASKTGEILLQSISLATCCELPIIEAALAQMPMVISRIVRDLSPGSQFTPFRGWASDVSVPGHTPGEGGAPVGYALSHTVEACE